MRRVMGSVAALVMLAACGAPQPPQAPAGADREDTAIGQDFAPAGWTARTLPDLAAALEAGEVTSETLVAAYLDRIARIDDPAGGGPALQSVLALNPNALEEARRLDAMAAAGERLGPLHGVPILLKDNIESADAMPTTAGALALEDNVTGRDSPLVAGLRAQGAIILGKTNLSQWANFRSVDSISGWSALGGQVRNPHMLDRSPCGSSSGSGAAIAASLAAGAVGTETNGSIICPAQVNGIVGFKPSVGLVSQQYIVPISSSQDAAGPMTKTVTGAAMMLDAMVAPSDGPSFAERLDAQSLAGARIGVMRFAEGENGAVKALFADALAALEAQGAILVEIEEFELAAEDFFGKARTVLDYEFKATLNAYLADSPADLPARTLSELIAFNLDNAEVELALFDQSIFDQAETKGDLATPDYVEARDAIQAASRAEGLDRLMAAFEVDVLVSPSGPVASRIDPINGDVWLAWAGAGYLAAVAGYPHLTVPMGAVHGVPVGVSFMGARDGDAAVLSYGFAYEQATGLRPEPAYLTNAEDRPEIARAMRK